MHSLTGWRSIVKSAVCCTALLWLGISQAQTTYVHDANRRVVAVTQSNGTTVQYSYDALGHVGPVSTPLSAGQLAIFAFMPTHGVAGAEVTLDGQGFSSAAANDSVSFNGTLATVLSASATQLVVDVPNGATKGPISVTVAGQAATSATPFVIDDMGVPPTITQVSPLVVAVGGTVTVTGTHLDPVAGDTSVQMGDRALSLSAAADASLQYVVPSDGTSGFVTVTTPYGVATSPNPVIVAPSGVSASNVVSSGNVTTNGTGATLTIGAAGQIGAVTFNATQGAWMSLQTSNITTATGSVSYSIYAPGNTVILTGTISASSPSIHLPQLTASGTYLATFQPTTAGAQFSVTTESNPAALYNVPLPMAAAGSGQSKRFVFDANAGDNLELALENVSVAGGGSDEVQFSVLNLAGSSIGSGKCSAAGSGAACRYSLWNLAAGTYSVIVSPSNGGTINFTALLQLDVVGGALTANTPATINLGMGQIERFTFTANAGDTVALDVSGVSTTPSGQGLYALVYSPTTTTITPQDSTTGFNTSSSTTINLTNLPATGTYTVVFYTLTGIPATAQVTLAAGVTGTVTSNGGAQSYAANVAGQNVYLTFTANAGDNLEFALENISVAGGSSDGVQFDVYNSGGSSIGSGSCSSTGSGIACRYSLWNLAAGTYSVIVSPSNGGTISFTALLQSDMVGGALTANTPATINLGVGQIERFTFTGNAGDTVVLDVSGVSTTPLGQGLYALVYSPSTTTITTGDSATGFNTSGSTTMTLSNLPATGTYTVVFYTLIGIPATAQLTLVPR